MHAYALIHFGNNPKYLELEIYFIKNLQRNTVYDIIYLYSVADTPQKYVDIIESLSVKTVPYDDTGITYNITNFVSGYQHFNTLRTCNFIYAYKLLDYKKICIIESDMVIMSNIDNIFKFKCPSILYYPDEDKVLLNHKVELDKKVVLNSCNDNSYVNGGVLILKPSLKIFDKYLNGQEPESISNEFNITFQSVKSIIKSFISFDSDNTIYLLEKENKLLKLKIENIKLKKELRELS